MTSSLWSSSDTPDSETNALSNPFELALAFSTSTDGFLNAIRWYRVASGGNRKPVSLTLWDAASQGVVWQTTAIPDNGSAGWQTVTLGETIPLQALREYRVSYFFVGGQLAAQEVTTSPTPDSPLSYATTRRYYNINGHAFPNTTPYAALAVGIDVLYDTVPPTGATPVPSDATTGSALNDWLTTDSAENSHQSDGLPWRTDANVTTTKNLATGATGFDAIKAVADAISATLGSTASTIGNVVTTISGQIVTAVGNTAQTGIATIGAISHDLAQVDSKIIDTMAQLGGVRTGSGTFPSAVGPLTWTLLDEQDFTGNLAYAQPADLYALTVTTPANGQAINDVAGVSVIYRAGWWCPLNGSFIRQRRYFDGQDNHLEIGGERMPGVLVQAPPDLQGHIQAWGLI